MGKGASLVGGRSHSACRPWLLEQKLPNGEGVGGQRGRMGKGPEPVPIRIISRIDGKDLGQDGSVMGTLRFAHPTGLL